MRKREEEEEVEVERVERKSRIGIRSKASDEQASERHLPLLFCFFHPANPPACRSFLQRKLLSRERSQPDLASTMAIGTVESKRRSKAPLLDFQSRVVEKVSSIKPIPSLSLSPPRKQLTWPARRRAAPPSPACSRRRRGREQRERAPGEGRHRRDEAASARSSGSRRRRRRLRRCTKCAASAARAGVASAGGDAAARAAASDRRRRSAHGAGGRRKGGRVALSLFSLSTRKQSVDARKFKAEIFSFSFFL